MNEGSLEKAGRLCKGWGEGGTVGLGGLLGLSVVCTVVCMRWVVEWWSQVGD